MCSRWQKSFENFWADMGATYKLGLTLERVNNAKGYSPANCVWATHKAQARNRRGGTLVDVALLSEKTGISKSTLYYRLAHGWSEKDLVRRPCPSNRFTTS